MSQDELEDLAGDYGEILKMESKMWVEGDSISSLVEYVRLADREKALDELNGRKMEDWDMKLECSRES